MHELNALHIRQYAWDEGRAKPVQTPTIPAPSA